MRQDSRPAKTAGKPPAGALLPSWSLLAMPCPGDSASAPWAGQGERQVAPQLLVQLNDLPPAQVALTCRQQVCGSRGGVGRLRVLLPAPLKPPVEQFVHPSAWRSMRGAALLPPPPPPHPAPTPATIHPTYPSQLTVVVS